MFGEISFEVLLAPSHLLGVMLRSTADFAETERMGVTCDVRATRDRRHRARLWLCTALRRGGRYRRKVSTRVGRAPPAIRGPAEDIPASMRKIAN
jgi:hypothetical protein